MKTISRFAVSFAACCVVVLTTVLPGSPVMAVGTDFCAETTAEVEAARRDAVNADPAVAPLLEKSNSLTAAAAELAAVADTARHASARADKARSTAKKTVAKLAAKMKEHKSRQAIKQWKAAKKKLASAKNTAARARARHSRLIVDVSTADTARVAALSEYTAAFTQLSNEAELLPVCAPTGVYAVSQRDSNIISVEFTSRVHPTWAGHWRATFRSGSSTYGHVAVSDLYCQASLRFSAGYFCRGTIQGDAAQLDLAWVPADGAPRTPATATVYHYN